MEKFDQEKHDVSLTVLTWRSTEKAFLMFSKVHLLSRFFAVPHRDADNTLLTAIKDGNTGPNTIEDPGLALGRA